MTTCNEYFYLSHHEQCGIRFFLGFSTHATFVTPGTGIVYKELLRGGGLGAPAWAGGAKVWDPPPLLTIVAWVGGCAV